jgi:hypothetical protein
MTTEVIVDQANKSACFAKLLIKTVSLVMC